MSHYALCRFAAPFRRNRALLPLAGHHARKGRRDFSRIGSDQLVGPDRDGFRPFCVVMQGQTGGLQRPEPFQLACGLIEGDRRVAAG
jgi:hypothetical protein